MYSSQAQWELSYIVFTVTIVIYTFQRGKLRLREVKPLPMGTQLARVDLAFKPRQSAPSTRVSRMP